MSVHLRIEPPGDAEPFERDVWGTEIIIGRAPSVGLVIADSSASRRHVRLFERDNQWWVEDLGTRNGTRLNKQPLTAPANLHPGDCIRVGETNVRVALADPIAATGTGPPTSSARVDPAASVVESDRQAARFRTLNEIHRALATPISLSALLDLILERCFDVLRPEEGVILLRGKDGEMQAAASRRLPGTDEEIFISRRIVDEVAGKGTAALVLDAAADSRFANSESIMMSGVRSVVAAPLTDADGTIGLIALCSRLSVRQFAAPDLEMLASLASAAVLRVRNVALAEEAAARRVLEHELSLAHDMQMAMLPKRLPERSSWPRR